LFQEDESVLRSVHATGDPSHFVLCGESGESEAAKLTFRDLTEVRRGGVDGDVAEDGWPGWSGARLGRFGRVVGLVGWLGWSGGRVGCVGCMVVWPDWSGWPFDRVAVLAVLAGRLDRPSGRVAVLGIVLVGMPDWPVTTRER
jgi:hypothetical protein